MILALRTDKPEVELYLLDTDGKESAKHVWEAHRQLAATLVEAIQSFLKQNQLEATNLTGIIVFTGAGSFTGLRIGTTVANALAYSHALPIASGEGDDWIAHGLAQLSSIRPGTYVIPQYDKEPNITKPK